MVTLTDDGIRPGAFILTEEDGHGSRDNITIESGSGVVKAGTVLALKSVGAGTSAAKSGGNTGNGTFVLDATAPVKAGAKVGVYTIRNILFVANGGTYRLTDPDGFVLQDLVMTPGAGATVTFDNDIKGVLTDGTTDFILGDGFDITIAAGSAKYVPAKAVGTGTPAEQTGRAINIYPADATSGDVKVSAITNNAEVNGKVIIYHSSVDDDTKKAAKNTDLAQRFIKVR